ncbi:dienelactone hydrolase family protein [Sulfurirhabdus autotrophica]|uniref:Dienelactone hydrolase family protein n=1 Tax=Sulfurirhabdus autotrophica TaxID=1706046 RepID=A0A4R3YJ36_9PROT|nr:alpha/beta family hydrolase [Sulfurirhabdus autotrophica]TCV90713.1 dienelactone hydrolase family protein [Sulfurirhabdus autotrophica]
MTAKLEQLVHIPADQVKIEGMLVIPEHAKGLVLFAHGSGSSRHSPRNNYVAQVLRESNIGTLLMDLLTPQEDMDYETRFNIPLLTRRLLAATQWIKHESATKNLPIGYFGASTGAAAALQAAAEAGKEISAVVSRGGRPDLAGNSALYNVKSPTLLLIGGFDDVVTELNREAYSHMNCPKEFSIIQGATHLFEEPGTLEEVAHQAAAWFSRYLMPPQVSQL